MSSISPKTELTDAVANIFACDSDHKAQFESLVRLCSDYLPIDPSNRVNVNAVLEAVQAVITLETGSMVVSRQFVSLVTDRLENNHYGQEEVKAIAEGILGIIKTRTISYEDQVCILRLLLASIYEKEGRLKDAARTLIAINSDSSPKFNGPKANMEGAKAQLCIRITRLLLECEEIDEAEQFVNRTSLLMVDVDSPDLIIEHKALQARVADAKRRFLEAAVKYYEMSQTDALPNSDRRTALEKTIVCILLAKPGAQRNRLLATLFKDERAHGLPSFELVAKMYLNRLVHRDELAEFENHLKPHQRVDENGESILKNVIQEHNITAVSQLYINVSFKTLGDILGVSPEAAELMAGEMIASERVSGYIDQSDGLLHFEDVRPMRVWDMQILTTLQQVNKVSDLIIERHPHLANFESSK
ncbi:unnamed protein product [Caenorhabditis bovis]|uniref:COP9 signalosome complex subunit 4 n=1 Tax=Caenorhabditis bovis TaxID=2654633 RepID=A0A8S1F0M0_9PELO|nr:unnamed protein product [Caenorhabditis bovis]